MNEVLLPLLVGLFVGLAASGLGALTVRMFRQSRGIQLAFTIRLALDLLGFLIIYFIYNSTSAYLGVALGLLSYKNILFFRALLGARREKGKE